MAQRIVFTPDGDLGLPRVIVPVVAAASPLSVLDGFERLIESIRRSGAPLDTAFDAREALGRMLARNLIDGDEKALAGLSKEYRAVIADLVAEVASDADDDTFASVLPPKVRNPKEP